MSLESIIDKLIPYRLRLFFLLYKSELKRHFFIVLGILFFIVLRYCPPLPDAIDPRGDHFILTEEGKTALAIFFMASTWWFFEAIPIGVTALAVGVAQALFHIRPAEKIFYDYMDPSIMFILASVVISMVFTKTKLTKRIAYKTLSLMGERTSMIYLGSFLIIMLLTHVMYHAAVAATLFPLLLTIYSLYTDDDKPTKFGKGLFISMAYVAGVGSTITMLGAARSVMAISFFHDMTGKDISFLALTKYTFPMAWLTVFLLWGFFMLYYKPEKNTIPGLNSMAKWLYKDLGPMSQKEGAVLAIVAVVVALLTLRSFIPTLAQIDKSALLLISTLLFFVFKLLDNKDLEEIPWNVILLAGGAMSMGFCIWETGAAKWLAVHGLVFFSQTHWFAFVIGFAFLLMILSNFVLNVVALTVFLPVGLVVAPYLGVAQEVVFYASVIASAMPFLILLGAAPNAIAYESKQFTATEFFIVGIPTSLLIIVILSLFIAVIWPIMGMPMTITK
jgi:sodium-dependent dicarboxylate transporter 2/3/5